MKFKKVLKSISCLAIALSMMFALPVFSFASLSKTYSGSFNKSWMDRATTVTSDGAKAYLEYGFNTTLINEDVANSLYYGDEHYSKIRNGSGKHKGPRREAGEWSDLEVRHSGSRVTYYSIW